MGLLAISAIQANALTVVVTRLDGYYSGRGGEFTVMPRETFCWGDYGLLTHNQQGAQLPNFQSFCLESSVRIDLNTRYAAQISDKAIKGGVGPQGDPISIGTAWLYQSFAKQTLLGYQYSPGTDRAKMAGELQKAIWWLEDENEGKVVDWIAELLKNQFGDDWQTVAKRDKGNMYPNVRVLNLSPVSRCGDVQDMLVLTVPDGGLTLMLLGVSVGALALVSRKMRK